VLNAHVSEFPPLAVPGLMLSESHRLPHTCRSCFIIFHFMARGQSPITIVSFCSFEQLIVQFWTVTSSTIQLWLSIQSI